MNTSRPEYMATKKYYNKIVHNNPPAPAQKDEFTDIQAKRRRYLHQHGTTASVRTARA